MHVCQEYGDTLDFFSYLILFAPDFPSEDDMTMDRALSNLKHGLDAVESKTTRVDSLQKLKMCREDVDQASCLYRSGNVLEAEKHLQAAREWFRKSR